MHSSTNRISNNQKRPCETEELFAYEKQLYSSGARIIVGIDEVGRGALAGPVTAAAVVLGADWKPVSGLRDSKQLSAKRRNELARELAESVHSYHVAHVEAACIDEQGIMPALKLAMTLAVDGLIDKNCLCKSSDEDSSNGQTPDKGCSCRIAEPDKILVDGLPLRLFEQEEAITKGDTKIACIAAASVLAKVARDALMTDLHHSYPAYAFDSNKGYASMAHQQAIAEFGLTALHRRSFCQNFLQESLF